jgi:hypothetical protein
MNNCRYERDSGTEPNPRVQRDCSVRGKPHGQSWQMAAESGMGAGETGTGDGVSNRDNHLIDGLSAA